MKMLQLTVCAAIVLLLVPGAAATAQTHGDLQVRVQGQVIRTNGGEQPSVFGSTGAVVIGETTTEAISQMADICGLSISGRVRPGAISAWTVEVTPTRVADGAVTFHVRWARVRDGSRESTRPNGEIDLVLHPGESLPLDVVPLSPDVTMPYTKCNIRGTVLRVGVEYWPDPGEDRRVVATDMWLVERSPDGSERSQPLALRGRYNQTMPFFFNTLSDGGVALDIFGDAIVLARDGEIEMKLDVRSRVVEAGRSSTNWRVGETPDARRLPMFGARKIESSIRLKPGEVVSIELPRLNENASGAFASRALSIRIRAQQIR